ncbi:glycoside hydrolase family 99-like domain-containing protein [Paraburkholderia xenovorans]
MTASEFNKLGYFFDSTTRVWSRSREFSFPYSDGDEAEQRVASILAGAVDLSVLSDELAAQCTDWPSRYHLSPQRANLLRPFAPKLACRILEIGAGCGAITRFLGEQEGEVVAVEGSARRASIVASRTRDLANVKVVHDSFDAFESSQQFDVVTLIGVLEYAGIYGAGDDPVQHMLERARSFLKPTGTLIVAIENQLGLKYLAGMPEDHVGIPMYGVQDSYRQNGVITFGRYELQQRIESAGFTRVDLALPFPDYKLPVSIVLPPAMRYETVFDPTNFATQSVKNDFQLHVPPSFSLERAWSVAGRNRLLPDLSNSFIFLASPDASAERLFDEEILAMHYGTMRRVGFRKTTSFERTQDGNVMVRRRKISPALEARPSAGFRWVSKDEQLISGKGLEQDFLKIVTTRGWEIGQIGDFLRRYISVLNNEARRFGYDGRARSTHAPLPGELLDAIPTNVIIGADGVGKIIDHEWEFAGDCELGFIVFRALAGLGHLVTLWADPKDPHWLVQEAFFKAAFESAGLMATLADFDRYLDLEAAFQIFATGHHERMKLDDWRILRFQTASSAGEAMYLRGKVDQLEGALEDTQASLADREQQLATRSFALEQTHRELLAARAVAQTAENSASRAQQETAELRRAIENAEARFQTVVSSRSWRITRPMRGAARLLRHPSMIGQTMHDADEQIPLLGRVRRVAESAGGYRALAKYGYRLIRTEGVRGVESRIRRHMLGQTVPAGVGVAQEQPVATEPVPTFDVIYLTDADVATRARALRFGEPGRSDVHILVSADGDVRQVVACLQSISDHRQETSFSVDIVLDGSASNLFGALADLTNVRLRWTGGNPRSVVIDEAVRQSEAEFVMLLSSEVQVAGRWLDALVDALRTGDKTVVAGGKVVLPDGTLSSAGQHFEVDGGVVDVGSGLAANKQSFAVPRKVDSVAEACVLLRRSTFVELGGFAGSRAQGGEGDRYHDYMLRALSTDRTVVFSPDSIAVQSARTRRNTVADEARATEPTDGAGLVTQWSNELASLSDIRLIAFFLPQYHPIPENDEWWGKGFTEWTNVAKAHPNYTGQYQPHRPADLGYYDLRVPEVREHQAELAREAGLHGFCYYHYWFGGHRLLERPFNDVLASGKPDFPFCVCWANENWTRRWDGLESAVLMAQRHSDEDDAAFFRDLLPAFKDRRYIRINGRPLLLVYRISLLPNPKRSAKIWRDIARAEGIGEIYLAYVQSFDSWARGEKPSDFDFDAAVEFPPHGAGVPYGEPVEVIDPAFRGSLYDYERSAEQILTKARPEYEMFRGVMPSWDNTARKQHNGHIFVNASPEGYERWLTAALRYTNDFAQGEERIVFINAWNEWGEGNHLEPDVKYGHAFLDATRRALRTVTKR